VGHIFKILAPQQHSKLTEIAEHTAIIVEKFQISATKDLHLDMPVLMHAHDTFIIIPKASINPVILSY
jgi:hypothetical protein